MTEVAIFSERMICSWLLTSTSSSPVGMPLADPLPSMTWAFWTSR